jgi:hypothetical protein
MLRQVARGRYDLIVLPCFKSGANYAETAGRAIPQLIQFRFQL